MDNLPSQQETSQSTGIQNPSQQPDNKQGALKTFALLKVGIIELFFVAIVLILLFGILNNFNILPLSTLFPNQLGWLPRKEVPTGTSQQSPPPTIPRSLNLTNQAKQILTNSMQSILTSSLLPKSSADITLTQTQGIKESFSSAWDTKEGTVSAVLVVSPDGKDIVQSYLSFLKTESVPPSVGLTKAITSQFFSIQPNGTWGCKPIHINMTYCENFWEEEDGTRRGLAMKGLLTQGVDLISGKPEVMLVFCEHTKQSKLYSWKSCEYEFAKTGVQ